VDRNVQSVITPRGYLPKQKEVLDALEKDCKRYVLYSGAFGAGKTLLECHAVIRQCIKYPGSLWLMGAMVFPMVRDTILRTFLHEVELYQKKIDNAGLKITLCEKYLTGDKHYKFYNGSEVLFRSFDDPSKYKSLNLDGFAIDEPVDVDEQIFLMLQGRMRGTAAPNCKSILAGNPSGKTNWVYKKFFENNDKDYYHVHTTTYDNTYLPKNYIPDMEKSYDGDYINRYLKGIWGSFEGQIYKDFNYDKHVGNYASKEVKYHIGGFDAGYRNPACLLVVGVGSDNEIYVKKEFYKSGLTSEELAKETVFIDSKYNMTKLYIDPSAIDTIEIMRTNKLRVMSADNDIDSGISKLKSMFRNDLIFIDRSCVNLIKEVESYRYEKDRLSKNKTEKPYKMNDHSVDALRYSVTNFNPFRQSTPLSAGHWGKNNENSQYIW